MPSGKVTVLVYEVTEGLSPGGLPSPSLFVAFVAANPSLRSTGGTEDEAVRRLKATVLSYVPSASAGRVGVNVTEVDFGDVPVMDVMEG